MDKRQVWIKKINPLNYLAGKIFLGFWLMFILTGISMLIIVSYMNPINENKPVPHHVFNLVRSIEEHIHRMHKHNSEASFEVLLRSPRLGRSHLFIYFDQNDSMKSSQRLPPEFDPSQLKIDNPEPTAQIQAELIVYGPFTILDDKQTYRLFSLYPYRPNPLSRFRQLPGWLRLGLPMAISALLSFMVALSLVTPIRQLRNAHRSLAQGNLDTRSNGVALRNDELGELGQDFDDMAVKISQLLAAQKRLLGDVSHELRSPLARLQIALGLALQPDTKDLPRHLQRIELEANRLDGMIGDVLRLSRLESQLQNIEKYPLSLNSLLSYLVQDANFEALQANKSVLFEDCEEIQVLGDQALLASAFENVLRNAVKYTEVNTSVSVRMSTKGNNVEVSISDQGPGVPVSALSQLFEPFYRVSDSRQRKSGGTGLGLAIAEKSIRSHGGSIVAQNLPEQGLEITITLPLSQ